MTDTNTHDGPDNLRDYLHWAQLKYKFQVRNGPGSD